MQSKEIFYMFTKIELVNWLKANLIFLESVYYLSGIFVFISAIVAIIALKSFRTEAKIRFRRDALQATLIVVDQKKKELIHLDDLFWAHQSSLNDCPDIPYSVEMNSKSRFILNHNVKNGVILDKTGLPDLEYYKYFHDDKNKILFNLAMDVLNELENISQYVFSGLLDAEKFFQMEAEIIIFYIEKQSPNIAVMREHRHDDFFGGIVQLYDAWKPMCEKKFIEKQMLTLQQNKDSLKCDETHNCYYGKTI